MEPPMPGAPAAPTSVSAPVAESAPNPSIGSRVLYVDDEASLCRAFARLFRDDAKFAVSTLSSPEEAADLIRRQPFDVIVSDLRMPGMSGIELLAAARRTVPEAPRLLGSGYAGFQPALAAINEVGVDRLLTKPWENEEVRGAVRAAANHALLQRE